MRVLFLFLDGVGLGEDDPEVNPWARLDLPELRRVLAGASLLRGAAPLDTERATLVPLDANLGVPGLPQSATGQATLLTGQNVPATIGYHYGPKPDPQVTELVRESNLFIELTKQSRRAALLNAYPPRYFQAIESGRRLYSAVPLAVTAADQRLMTAKDLFRGRAMSADFTAEGWRDNLGFPEVPVMDSRAAGAHLAELASSYDLAFFEYWLSDFIGHKQDMKAAAEHLEAFDRMLGGLLASWDLSRGLILITSDHGNMEDLSTRRHTNNPVPGLVIGDRSLRRSFVRDMHSIQDVTPAIVKFLNQHP